MANKPKVTKRLFNSVKKLAKTGVNKTYIMKVSGLSNGTVYRILRAKTYEEYRGNTAKMSKRDYAKRKQRKSNRSNALKLTHEKLDQIQDGQRFIYAELSRLSNKVDCLESACKENEPQPKKHWWSR